MTNQPFGPGERNSGMTPLERAHTQLGVRESGGENCGPMVKVYLASVGLPEGHRWCVAFAHWCHQDTGVWFPKTASCLRFVELCVRRGLRSLPRSLWRPGDIGVRVRQDGKNHLTILSRPSQNAELDTVAWEDISGNTNEKGSNNGGRVGLVVRPLSYYTHVFRLS